MVMTTLKPKYASTTFSYQLSKLTLTPSKNSFRTKKQKLSKLEMTQFFIERRVFSCKIKVARVGNYLWIECRHSVSFFMFAFGNWWLLSRIMFHWKHFIVSLPSRFFNKAKWNQKFMRWFMWKYFLSNVKRDSLITVVTSSITTRAHFLPLYSLFMLLLPRKLVLGSFSFSFFFRKCVAMFVKWIFIFFLF